MCPKGIDFFDDQRYKLNKILMCCNGQWPYQKKSQKIFFRFLTLMYSATCLPAQFIEAYIHRDDWFQVLPVMSPIIVHIGFLIQFTNSIVLGDKLLRLLDHIRSDWSSPMGFEKKILERFVDDGRNFTVVYTTSLYITILIYLLLSTIPHVIVMNGWANFSSPILFSIPVYFTENVMDHYIIVQIHVSLGIVLLCSVDIAVDTMFIVFVQHACAILSIIGFQLEHIMDDEDPNIDLHPDLNLDTPYRIMVDCIKKHQEALKFVDVLESAYSWSLLALTGLIVLSISFAGLQMLQANPDSIDEAIRQILLVTVQVTHLFFQSFFSERLTDHCLEVYHSLTRSKWYRMSFRTRQLLRFMLMKSIIHWRFKAGKIYTTSMQNFSAVIRTSVSYLMILRSIE